MLEQSDRVALPSQLSETAADCLLPREAAPHLCRLSWLRPLAAPSDRPDSWLQRLDDCLDTSIAGNKILLCLAGDDLCTHSRPVKYITHSRH